MPGQVGMVVGDRFELGRAIGRGTYGDVWEAVDRVGGDRVAVKLLHPEMAARPRIQQRFQQEGQLLSRLEHPNIARGLAWSVQTTPAFLAMEYIDGESLADRAKVVSRADHLFRSDWICAWVDAIAQALDYAQLRGVVHRDLKPRNVMVNREGEPGFLKVLDFGIAKLLTGSEMDPTTAGRVVGSVLYMSPEQVRAKPVDGRADVFALASIAFELLSLHRAWAVDADGGPLRFHERMPKVEGNSPVGVLLRIAQGPRPQLLELRPDLPDEAGALLDRALAIDPEARPDRPRDFAQQLRAALRL